MLDSFTLSIPAGSNPVKRLQYAIAASEAGGSMLGLHEESSGALFKERKRVPTKHLFEKFHEGGMNEFLVKAAGMKWDLRENLPLVIVCRSRI